MAVRQRRSISLLRQSRDGHVIEYGFDRRSIDTLNSSANYMVAKPISSNDIDYERSASIWTIGDRFDCNFPIVHRIDLEEE